MSRYARFCFLVAAFGFSSLFAGELSGKKVLYIDSYHEGYGWSDGIARGVKKVVTPTGATLETIFMDTKRNAAEDFKKQAAIKVVAKVTEFKPDVIIAADDNASKYVIVPTYKDKEPPVVFCGINWDATAYGFPCANVTGMLEVTSYNLLAEKMKAYAKGTKVGFLGIDNETSRKEADNTEKVFKVTFEKKYVKTFDEWKKAFVELQGTCDWVFADNNAGITGWDDAAAAEFALANTTVPTGSIYEWMVNVCLMSVAKSPDEQGEWAGAAALKILKGTPVAQIPVEKNKKGDLYLNMKIAQKLGVSFDLGLVKIAKSVVK